MTQPSFIALRREVPWKKWYQELDAAFAVFIVLSLLIHAVASQFLRELPERQAPTMVIRPFDLTLSYPVDESLIPLPEPILPSVAETPPSINTPTEGRTFPQARGYGTPGRGSGPGNVLDVLNDHPEILQAITTVGGDDGFAEMTAKISPNLRLNVPYARLADAGGDLPLGAIESHEVGIAWNMPGTAAPGTVNLPERKQAQPGVRAGKPETDAVDAETGNLVRRALRARLSGVRMCYERRLNYNVNLAGSVRMLVVFGADGRVQSVRLLSDGLGDAEAISCIAEVLRRADAGRPLGQTVSVRVPYVFSAVN